jgi:hypothetical protein
MLGGALVAWWILVVPTAHASTADEAIKAWSDRSEPASEAEQLTPLPDGSGRRGPESAHGLLLRAQQYAQKGDNQLAVSMAAACQNHNRALKQAIEDYPEEVLAHLKKLSDK